MIKNKKHTSYAIMLAFSALFISSFVCAMDEPTGQDAPIYVATADGQIKRVERWKIDEMNTLRVLLEKQSGSNLQANPLQVSILTSIELDLLNNAWDAIAKGTFDAFYEQMVGGQAPALLSISGSLLSTLIEAAEKVEAKVVSAFCLSRVVPSDVQKNALIPYLIEPIIDNIPLRPLRILNAQSDLVSGVVFSPDGRYALVCGLDNHRENNLLMWDVIENKFSFLENVGCSIRAIWSPDGKYIVISGADNQNNLCVYDVATKQSRVLVGHPSIFGLAFSSDGKHFVTGSSIENQDNVIIWDMTTGEKLISMQHPGRVNAVAWSPDGNYIVSGGYGDQYNVIIWNAKTGEQYISIKHPGRINAVAFSPDGKYVVAGGGNDLIVWDGMTGKQYIFIPNLSIVNVVAWSQDGRYIISSRGRGLIVWNAMTGEQLKVGQGHSGHISSVAISPDGQYIVSGCLGGENNLILWSLLSIKEKEALRNCTFAQAQLLYQLVLASVRGARVQLESPDVIQIFKSLSDVVKNILQERFGVALPIKCKPSEQGSCIIF